MITHADSAVLCSATCCQVKDAWSPSAAGAGTAARATGSPRLVVELGGILPRLLPWI